MAIEVRPPYPVFYGSDGKPLENGYIFVGVSGLNPLSNPQSVYWDKAMTIPAAAIRTRGGYPFYNGAPGRLYVLGDYSLLVQDHVGRTVYYKAVCTIEQPDLFMTSPRSTLSRSMRVPPSYNINNILESGRYAWTNAGTTNYPSDSAAADLFGLDVSASPDGSGLVHQRIIDFTLSSSSLVVAFERVSLNAGATWTTWATYISASERVVASTSTTPYSVVGDASDSIVFVTTGAGAFVVNLPSATAARVGNEITIVKVDSGVGVIQIAPNGADVVANAGNVSIYIGTQFRHVTLKCQAAGQWIVIGGEFVPDQAVDTDGSQIALGRLHLLPLNETDRRITSSPAASLGGYAGPYTIVGVNGVPAGAKAVRFRIGVIAQSVAAGACVAEVVLSPTNPILGISEQTDYPRVTARFYADAANRQNGANYFVDVVPNSSGQIYLFTYLYTNVTFYDWKLVPVGFYMGD